jgi:hypothetical protein
MASDPKDEEVAELKARLAALESATPSAKKTKSGCLGPGLAVLGLVFTVVLVRASLLSNPPADPAGADLTAAPVACDTAWATKTWSAASHAGVVRGEKLDGMIDLIVLVSPYSWNALSLTA